MQSSVYNKNGPKLNPEYNVISFFLNHLCHGDRVTGSPFFQLVREKTKAFPGQRRATWVRREILSKKTKNRIIVTDSFSFEQTVLNNFRISSLIFYVLLSLPLYASLLSFSPLNWFQFECGSVKREFFPLLP